MLRLARSGQSLVSVALPLFALASFGFANPAIASGAVPAATRRLIEPPAPAMDEMNVAPFLAYQKARSFERLPGREVSASPNQLAYDARHYVLDLRPDPATATLFGRVIVRATVESGPLSVFELDFDSDSMLVDSVLSGALPVPWTHTADKLQVNLERPYFAGEPIEVAVRYHGRPEKGAFNGPFTFDFRNGQPLIWTLSEPFGARSWWPCKDVPDDKADSVDVRVTVPAGMKTAGNGLRLSATDDGTWSITHWRERHPIATYLVFFTSHAYTTYSDWFVHSPTDSMEIAFFMYPDQVGMFYGVNAKVKDMLAALTARFGPYPFLSEKYGHAQFTFNGGMEHQTCTSIGVFSEFVVVHELAHQWFGNGTTLKNFHDIWLNEGFATYGEALWAEAKSGEAGYRADMATAKYYGPGTVYSPVDNDVSRVFNPNLSYHKGSWVLHMLRHVLGDAAFFTALQTYRLHYPYGNASTAEFQDVCEMVSGRNLDAFFQQWIYGEYYPSYRFTWTSAPVSGGYLVTANLQQTQSWQLFQMPVDLHVQTAAGETVVTVLDSLAQQSFTFQLPAAPTSILVDPDEWILRAVEYPLAVEGPAPEFRLSAPRPNPARGDAVIDLAMPARGDAAVSIYDAAGRRVVDLHRGTLAAGPHTLRWNGADQDGRPTRSGIFWVVAEAGGERRTHKLVRIE